MNRRRTARLYLWLPGLLVILCVLLLLQAMHGPTGVIAAGNVLQGAFAMLGLTSPLEGLAQTALELRIQRALCAAMVGASLALSGALLQGLFRNGLAAPSLIGVSGGASLGAVLALLMLGGYGAGVATVGVGLTPYVVTFCAFLGAFATTAFVLTLATRGGVVSVPVLLLVGVAVNACIGGLLAAIQAAVLQDWEVSKAILVWTFGTLDDRQGWHVGLATCGLLISLVLVPFVAIELDLFAGGEDDAKALGVATRRTKLLALIAATVSTAAAVAVAGQIAFVGLVVPHVMRLLTGNSHRTLLWLAPVAGAVLLVGLDLVQLLLTGRRELPPGVLMSLVGGPFFLFLLLQSRRGALGW